MGSEEHPIFLRDDIPVIRPGLPDNFGVGSEIIIKRHRRSTIKQVVRATVTSAARIWITAESGQRFWRFRRDDQTSGQDRIYGETFLTQQQLDWYQAHQAARNHCFDRGIRVEPYSPWNNRVIELARFVWYAEHERNHHVQAPSE